MNCSSDLKTKGSRRALHLSPPLVDLREGHRRSQEAETLQSGDAWGNDENLMYTSTYGRPLDPGDFGK